MKPEKSWGGAQMAKGMVCCGTLVLLIAALATGRGADTRPDHMEGRLRISPSSLPHQANQKAANEEALADLKKRLGGHEEEPAEEFFKNIETLKGRKASILPGMMSALTGLLGVDCIYCHVNNQWDKEDKPAKQTARKMFRMIGMLNKDFFDGKNAVSCWTCHRGNPHPPISGQ
jgi:hypothetical protein